jgi:pimeloyl-ACP methyl ester carboxylesterase
VSFGTSCWESLAESYRLIAFDLPRHGQSSDAPDPSRTYTRPGLADATTELLEKLSIERARGGHIAIEMISRYSGMLGLPRTRLGPCGDQL